MPRLAAALLGVVVLFASVDAQRAVPPSITALLDAYNRRDFAGAVQAGTSLSDVEAWRKAYPREAGQWIDAEKSQAVRRRLVGAAFLIEVARERFATDSLTFVTLFPVIGWTCDQLRKSAPSTDELAWHHALLAFVERVGGQDLLLHPWRGSGGAAFPCGDDPNKEAYLTYVQRRFSTDPRLKFQGALFQVAALDEGLGRPQDVRRAPSSSPPMITGLPPASSRTGTPYVPPPLVPPPNADGTIAALRLLEPFRKDVDVSGEAEARIASLYLTRRNFVAALDHASAALTIGGEAPTRYVAQVFRGRALEGLGRPVDARDAYLGALAVLPDGESAALLLAILNSSLLPSADTVVRAEAALGQAPRDQDPLRLYAFGDYIRWSTYVAALHAALP